MSKTTIFLILLVAGAGLAIGILTNFNPLTAIQNLISNPSSAVEWLKSVPQTIQQNWQTLLGIVTGAGGMLVLASRAYSNYKQSRQQVEETLQTTNVQMSETITQLQASKEEAEATLTAKQTEYTDAVTKLSGQLADGQEDYRVAMQDVTRLTEERNMLSNKIKAITTQLEDYQKRFGELYVK